MTPIQYLVTGKQMQEYDRNTIEHFLVPGIVLMEQAALAVTEEILIRFPMRKEKILILAGKGNNGGDAMAVARLLTQKKYRVTVCIISNNEFSADELSESAGVQYKILRSMNVEIVTQLPDNSYDIYIDGMLGVGCNRFLEGKLASVIKELNEREGYKIALDVPTGIDATSGTILGVAYKAHCTVTFGFEKRGLYLYPGAFFAGEVVKKEIGITPASFLGKVPEMFYLSGKVTDYLPYRVPWGHKGTFGKILTIAGSKEIAGAAYFSAKAALMTGCGMVKVCIPKNQQPVISSLLPEALLSVYETIEDAKEKIQDGISWCDVIVMGPGMGNDELSQTIWDTVIEGTKKPLVLDADGITILAKKQRKIRFLELQTNINTCRPLVLTPHKKELSRLVGKEMKQLEEEGVEGLQATARLFQGVLVSKDARTLICDTAGQLCLNLTGNNGMATAGSGDVLTGIIAGFLAQSMTPFDAACVGVFVHGHAGDRAAGEKNPYSMVAGDICNALSYVLQKENH